MIGKVNFGESSNILNLVYTPSVSVTRLTCDIFEVPHENDGDAVDLLFTSQMRG